MIKTFSLLISVTFLIIGCSTNNPPNISLAAMDNSSGFGGTGILKLQLDEEGSGFGGTGIVGNIQAFGSIWVNGVEIEYDSNVKITSNMGTLKVLKLGQQVIVETDLQLDENKLPKTQKIEIYYPLAGQIQAIEKNKIKLQNQWVHYLNDTYRDENINLTVGQYVMVNAVQQNKHWLASRLNENPSQISAYQPQLKLNFSTNVRAVIFDPEIAKMQWQNIHQFLRNNKNQVLIGHWDHTNQQLKMNSIQLKTIGIQHELRFEKPPEAFKHLNEMRQNIRHSNPMLKKGFMRK